MTTTRYHDETNTTGCEPTRADAARMSTHTTSATQIPAISQRSSDYTKRRTLGRMLKAGTARIVGRVSTGAAWNDGAPKAWIIDTVDGATYHVRCDDRPSWRRYCPVASL
jgi:hypothetical protein